MGKSGTSFGKKEQEKKKAKLRQEKQEKMADRKANAKKGKSLDDMMAYIDEDGNISSTPPDPSKKKVFNQEDIQIGVPKYEESADDGAPRTGTVNFFNEAKGFGFIKDKQTGESVFVHINQLQDRIKENDKVSFDVEKGPRGLSALNVKKIG